ncbi:MAG: hydantoinase/oxoprolinase family protein [Candidatus Rokubacteria bacterium]|nr:hydantoinase/oxoprolinase family protein [Candidatus Rokubacteria bacterium]
MNPRSRYRIGVDVGGTFTDFLLQPAAGPPRAVKVPSTPHDPTEGVFAGLAEMAAGEGPPLADFLKTVDLIVHGTTITTNAVLTGDVARVGLLTTRGFRDALAMRRGIREAQYDNRYRAPEPLVPRWLRRPVTERVDCEGRVLTPLEEADVREALARLGAAGVEAVAICFMHAWANAAHEVAAERLATAALPAAYVTRSSAILPQIRFTERVSTTVLNAAVGPVLGRYLDRLTARLAAAGFGGTLLVMQSNGGVAAPAVARSVAASTLLSGPAAAPTAGVAYTAEHAMTDFITVDMGGTSFDVCLVKDGAPAMTAEGRIARYPFGLPMLAIHTIGAGGGSIGWLDEGGLVRVGPKSAGAQPGPACYGWGGTAPTCTDADLLLGYLDAGYFLGGRLPLDPEAARWALLTLAAPLRCSVEDAAAGVFDVINANMAAGIRHVTVERGHDPRAFPLVVAGGAGPVHAAAIARELGIGHVLVPRDSSIFCAAGMLFSDLRHDLVQSCVAPVEKLEPARLRRVCRALLDEGDAVLAGEGVARERRTVALACDVRYIGQYHEITVPLLAEEADAGDASGVSKRFNEAHDRLYGYALPGTPLELVNVRAVATGLTDKPRLPEVGPGAAHEARRGRRAMWLAEERAFAEAAVYDGARLGAGARLDGPAIVELAMTTVVVPRGWRLECDRRGSFVLEFG